MDAEEEDEEQMFTRSADLNKCHLQEHEPLSHLLSILPQKAQKGLSSLPIEYTCIDVTPEYIALGTNVGLVLLYDRLAQSLQRLNCKIKTEVITCLRLAESVDYVVAAGTRSGKVFVFQLPSLLPGRVKRMQLYCVNGVHFSKITCVEWSNNTLKLFSGDTEGCVVCTEMDYGKQQSKSYIVTEEPHEIVQLDYSFKKLLVSTMFRSIVCSPGVSEKSRIGTKDRKVLGPFGACFKPELCRAEDATIFATRPGLRLWKADIDGNVKATYMFKDLLGGNTPVIALLPDTTHEHSAAQIEDKTFGYLQIFSDSKLVTWHDSTLLVLNPESGTFIGWHSNLGHIKGLSVCEDEIFILRGMPARRRVIRIAKKRDLLNETASVPQKPGGLPTSSFGYNEPSPSPVHILQQTASNLADAILGVGEKIKTVQEGQTPPWGLAADPNTVPSPDTDSCKEVNSQSSGSSHLSSPEKQSGGQPTILLNSPDTLTVILQDTVTKGKLNSDKETSYLDNYRFSESSRQTSRNQESEELRSRMSSSDASERLSYLSTISNEDDDIVFSPKDKAKHRKGKKRRVKSADKDADAESLCSVDSNTFKCEENDTLQVDVQDGTSARTGRVNSFGTTAEAAPRKSAHDAADYSPAQNAIGEERNKLQHKSVTPPPSQPNRSRATRLASQPQNTSGKEPESNPSKNSSDERTVDGVIKPTSALTSNPAKDTLTSSGRSSANESEAKATHQAESPYSELIDRLFKDNLNREQRNQKSGARNSKDSEFLSDVIKTEEEIFDAAESSAVSLEENVESETTSISVEETKSESAVTPSKNTSPRQTYSTSDVSTENTSSRQMYSTSDASTDDFYSKFKRSSSILSPGWSPEDEPSLEEALDRGESSEIAEANLRKDLRNRLADTWTEFLAPGNLVSICLTNRHIWCVDKSDRLHYSALSGQGLKWRKVDEPAKQISVSRSGWIVWRLHNGSAYAGTAITTRAPAGMKWVEAARDVAFICVDNTVAWYIKNNGDVYVQKNLSRERPSFRAVKVPSKAKLLLVACQDNVVWAVTEARSVFVRVGIKAGTEEGTDWQPLTNEGRELVVSSLAIGDNGTAWVVDVVGRVWFTTGVKWDSPTGTGKWWQVSLSECLMEDYKALDTLKSLATFPQNLGKILTKEIGGLITVGNNGIWMCPGRKHVLHVCRGGITGHRFSAIVPSGMATSAQWLNISASAVDNNNDGLIWAQQPNNAIFCFPAHNKKFSEVSQSETSSPFVCISSTKEAVWGLLGDGTVVIRAGMTAHCPQGIKWIGLDLIQLGSSRLVYLSCNNEQVWAVDNSGMVYLRIGIRPPGRSDHGYLNPAWVPVDGSTVGLGSRFNRVFAGPCDWMVWAVDTKRQVYVRKGISDSMPVGTHWSYVPGTTADKLCLSERYVYALSALGEVLVRFGVSQENPGGNYWKKVPGAFKSISVTSQDDLWGINLDGQLCQRAVYYLQRQDVLEDLSGPVTRDSIDDDWELL